MERNPFNGDGSRWCALAARITAELEEEFSESKLQAILDAINPAS